MVERKPVDLEYLMVDMFVTSHQKQERDRLVKMQIRYPAREKRLRKAQNVTGN